VKIPMTEGLPIAQDGQATPPPGHAPRPPHPEALAADSSWIVAAVLLATGAGLLLFRDGPNRNEAKTREKNDADAREEP